MPTPPNLNDTRVSPKEANFGMVVALAGALLIILFIVAIFFVKADGRGLLPRTRHRDFEPFSQLVQPEAAPHITQNAC